jgi:hypothetical protein
MLACGLMIAQMTEAKAVRDSVFLSHFPVTALPTMTLIAALFAILSGYAGSRVIHKVSPDRFAPLGFLISGVLQVGERSLLLRHAQLAACVIYLHVFAINLLLTSSFWSLMNEHYDPHSAKRAFGKIGGAGTFGGVAGGLIAERVAAHASVPALILVTAFLHLSCAAALFRFTRNFRPANSEEHRPQHEKHTPVRHVLRKTPYLLQVASLMIAVSIAAALLDYLFKAQAAATIPKGPTLTRFFAVFYTVTGLLGVTVQAFFSSAMLSRLGLANTVSLLPVTVLAGGGWVLAFFGFVSVTAVRAAEVVLRGSLFRAAYELFYTPVPTADKRAVKAIIDISGERLGDVIGSGVLGLLLFLHLSGAVAISWLAIAFSGVALILARGLGGSYAGALESSLRKQAVRLGPERPPYDFGPTAVEAPEVSAEDDSEVERSAWDPVLQDIADLRSGSEASVRRALARIEEPHPLLIHPLIELLGDDRYAFFAMAHLRRAAPARLGQLVDALLDPDQPFTVRKRIPLIVVADQSQRAIDALLTGVSDPEFLIRFRCAIAMSQMAAKRPELSVSHDRIWQVLNQELQVSREVWEGRRLLETGPSTEDDPDRPVERPGDASLEHVFVLLGLVLPQQPVSTAFRALQADDAHLRGTALEYLQTVLPAHAWKSLQGLLGESAGGGRTTSRKAGGN